MNSVTLKDFLICFAVSTASHCTTDDAKHPGINPFLD